VDIVLPREAVIGGTVVDEHGEPVEGLPVWAVQMRRRDGRVVGTTPAIARATDDRGQYRIVGVPPGSYLIAALATGDLTAGGAGRGYVSSYHPGATDIPLARPVVVDAGAHLAGIDIILSPVRTATVTGVIVDPAGRPFVGPVSLMTSARSGVASLGSRSTQTDATGNFVLRGTPPGDYVLKAPGLAGRSPLFGAHYVTVADGDPAPVSMKLSEGATLEGRLVLEVAPGTNPAGLELVYTATDFDREPTVLRTSFTRERDGTFRMTGIFGLSRLRAPRMPGCETCYLKSVRINGVDAADTPFDFGLSGGTYRGAEVVISDAGATIEGRVDDEREARAAFLMVVLPASNALRYRDSRFVKQAMKLRDGRFEAAGLPPGEYIAVATNATDGGGLSLDPNDPDLSALLVSRGTRLTVLERERASVKLRLLRRN
jgi:hypothetical protein